jgi:hypothetical protein
MGIYNASAFRNEKDFAENKFWEKLHQYQPLKEICFNLSLISGKRTANNAANCGCLCILSFISYKATCATKDHHGDAKNKTSCA